MDEELTGENIDDIISAIEDGTIGKTIDSTDTADLEDTETTEESEVTTDTEDEVDETESDTDSETEDEVDGEDTQDIEDDVDSDDEDGVDEDDTEETTDTDVDQSDEEGDEDIEGSDEEESDTEADEAEGTEDTNAASEFYRQAEEVEFMVNGKKVKGLGTIEDMVKARQMAGGLNDKFKAIKELRPFLAPLKERGLIENPDKFNLAMQIIDGDKEALKQFMHQSGIDPLTDEDMDMDNITYQAKNLLSSNEEIIYNDTLSVAKQYGVEEKFNKVVLDDWDSASLETFFKTPESAATIGTLLSQQIQNGIYDEVMGEVAKMESTDVNGTFGVKTSIEKYNIASQVVNARNTVREPVPEVDKIDTKKVEAAKKKIEEKRKKAAYTKKLEEQKTKADAARTKATAASKKKTKTAPAKKADPYSLEGDDLDQFVNELMGSFR